MRIAELSRRTGVPVPTVKYYLREGLLPAGRATAATQAQYDEGHEHRLRLVRALVEVGGLSLAAVRRVLAAVDDPPATAHELLGAAHEALPPVVSDEVDVTAAAEVVAALGWRVDPRSAPLRQLADAMLRLARGDLAAEVPGLGRADEVGRMAKAVGVFKQGLEDAARLAGVIVGPAGAGGEADAAK